MSECVGVSAGERAKEREGQRRWDREEDTVAKGQITGEKMMLNRHQWRRRRVTV